MTQKSPFAKIAGGVAGATAAASALSAFGALFMFTNFTKGNHEIAVHDHNLPFYNAVTSGYASELWSFTSFDGLKLKAHYFQASAPSHRYAITVHGYHGNYTDMMPYAQHYLEAGFNVIMPHLRGHGLSEGSYAGFGYHDHYDLCGWIDLLIEKDPEAQIILHGMSMGAATVMMASGEYLPSNVKCTIEDAGYADAYEQCTYNLKQLCHLPSFPVLNLVDLLIRARWKFSLRDAVPIRSVSHACVPMLFIHGEADTFVPYSNLQPLYDACNTEKEILSVKDAAHVRSVFTDPEAFFAAIDQFTARYLA